MPTATLPDVFPQTHNPDRAPTRAKGRGLLSSLVQPEETNPETAAHALFPGPLPKNGHSDPSPAEDLTTWDAMEAAIDQALEAQEHRLDRTIWDPPIPTPWELDFRHSFWHADRIKTVAAFYRTSTPAARINRFNCCGGGAYVQVAKDNGEPRIVSTKCHDRFCKACGNERQRVITQNLLKHCEGKTLRFMTLTLKHNSERLTLQIDRLFSCLTKLRERGFWKEHVTGGAVFFELKPSKDGRTWHPHLHLVVEGQRVPQDTLSSEWLAVTGDSSIVDIRFVYDPKATLGYVAKYASKPLDGSLYHWPNMLDEAIVALKGRRACTTFGTWRGLKLEDKPEDGREWINVGTIEEVRTEAMSGSLFHQQLCKHLGIDNRWNEAENGDSS